MIPEYDPTGKLPAGVHWATWADVVERFGYNPRRRRLLAGLQRAIAELTAAGCQTVYLDGSFVTSRLQPNDYDACWDARGVDLGRLDRILLAYVGDRRDLMAAYGGDLFPAHGLADPIGSTFLDFFQRDKFTGRPKGIVAIRLGDNR